MSEGLEKKPITFYVGDKSLFLEKEEKKLMSGKIKLLDFISLFSNPEDRYYAITIFEEKIPLVIKKSNPEDFQFFNLYVYNKDEPLYNLFVRDDREFFVETMASLERLKEICHYFGFEYEIESSGCEM